MVSDGVKHLPHSARRALGSGVRRAGRKGVYFLGGSLRAKVILVLASVLALSSADTATVGASAIELRHSLGIDNTDIGLLCRGHVFSGRSLLVAFRGAG